MSRIQHNMSAMNTHRMYTINNTAASKSAEKLSSGYRINRAGDDAAGLAISEKMRAQIRGLNMASKNSQDAISMVQTAEGALQEVHSMLQRMSELATQSNTGTNEDFDRSAISAEFEQLKEEINDIAEQTTFNNMKLFDGSLGSGTAVAKTDATGGLNASTDLVKNNGLGGDTNFQVVDQSGLTTSKVGEFAFAAGTVDADGKFTAAGTPDGTETHIQVSFEDANTGDKVNTVLKVSDIVTGDGFDKANAKMSLDLSSVGLGTYELTSASATTNTKANFMTDITASTLTTTNQNIITKAAWGTSELTAAPKMTGFKDGTSFTVEQGATTADVKFTNDATDESVTFTLGDGDAAQELDLSAIGGGKISLDAITTADDVVADIVATGQITVKGGGGEGNGVMIQVGANKGETLKITINKMDAEGLGVSTLSIAEQGEAVGQAGDAIKVVKEAINSVSDQRASLGAMQNRLEHKIKNLDNSAENLQSAEGTIRDVDMAAEMTEYQKQNILSQAATAMLAQANAAPQNVLQLLG